MSQIAVRMPNQPPPLTWLKEGENESGAVFLSPMKFVLSFDVVILPSLQGFCN
jgi:hypothetical protein